MEKRLFIVSNLLPVTIEEENAEESASEGLVTAIKSYLQNIENKPFSTVFWAGVPGCSVGRWSEIVNKTAAEDFTFLPVFINQSIYEAYYGHANSLLWPLFHYFPSYAEYNLQHYEQFQQVNEQFAHALKKYLLPGDTLWIHDYRLLLLPGLLRREIAELSIGFFLHIPFPSYEIFRVLPHSWQEDMLKGMLGADLIGFHINDYASHFLQSVQMTLGIDHDRHVLKTKHRLIKVDVFPLNIDCRYGKIWVQDFLNEIDRIKRKQKEFQIKFLDAYAKNNLMDCYMKASKRLILLDYDGTLIPFSSIPDEAIPGKELLQLLKDLNTGKNTVCLISGRSSEWLDGWFGNCNITLIAEHGARFKYPHQNWSKEVIARNDWKDDVKQIMQAYVRRCVNSFIEEKEFCMVWHFRNANPAQGNLRAAEMLIELNEYVRDRPLQVSMGNRIVEVKNSGIDKGAAIKKIMNNNNFDFTLAIGDDYTDEDMFLVLANKENNFTIKVGNEASYARYNLFTPHMVISLLNTISHI